jgi:hypothetical protein
MSDRAGPLVTVRVLYNCEGCIHHSYESYAVQGDSGHTHYCGEQSPPKSMGEDDATPSWCPFIGDRIL